MNFGPANQITTARAVLVALLASLAVRPATPTVAWGVVLVASVAVSLDGVDGWVARRTGTVSAFGARFDTETDAALILTLAILVWQIEKAGPWILAAGLMRYGFVAAGWLRPWMQRPLMPSLRGRAICVVQTVALIIAIAPVVTPPASTAVAALGLTALCCSFLVDTLWLWRHAGTP